VFSVKERSLATARARLGYATDRWLVFVTGGAAFARVEARDDNPPFADSETKTRTGWTVGGGAEYALMGNWSVKGEYLFADFGTSRYFTLPTVTLGGQADVPLKQHIFRLGLNYRFWGAN
jgi:outer membrane immunogenic protein